MARGALVLLAAAALVSLLLIRREMVVQRVQQSVVSATAALDRGERPSADPEPLDLSLPTRALLPAAMLRARVALVTQRRAALDEALAAADVALRRRPRWGEAEMVRAFVLAHRDGMRSAGAQAAFARSYAYAPYLRDGAMWRIGFGLTTWSALTSSVRRRWVDEAIWRVRLEPADRQEVFEAVRGTDAYLPLLLRWGEVRADEVAAESLR